MSVARSTSSPFSSSSVEFLVLSSMVGTLMAMAFDRATSMGGKSGPVKYSSLVVHMIRFSETRSVLCCRGRILGHSFVPEIGILFETSYSAVDRYSLRILFGSSGLALGFFGHISGALLYKQA